MSAATYLGEFTVAISDTPFENFTKNDWALYWITNNGGFSGAHHKHEALDGVVKILTGCDFLIKQARWSDHEPEYRIELIPSEKYGEWVSEYEEGEDGPETYKWNEE